MRVIRWIVFVAAGLIIVAALVCLVLGLRPFILTSGSMEPTVPKGSLVIVDTRATDVTVGDILAYRSEGNQFVLHRLVGKNELKGDANSVSQHIEIDTCLIGRELFHIPKVGYALQFVVKHKVIAFIAVGVLIIILLFRLRRHSSNQNPSYKEETDADSKTRDENKAD